jgi:AcrR family transcriptional regulator
LFLLPGLIDVTSNTDIQSTRLMQRTLPTRRTILEAAITLYHSQGAENTSVSSIIEASGLGRTTFYRHFKDADDVLNQAVLQDFEALMADFDAQSYEHADIAAQIVDDMAWFIEQLHRRQALRLLFTDNSRQLYNRVNLSLATFTKVGLACSQPTYERAQHLGRLRNGITLSKYVEWCTFIVVSFQRVNFPIANNPIQLRQMLQDFLVPSLITPPPGASKNL